ncbi:MAG TPA: S1C family serine protease [bacterium]|jgi:2-alkenal reductase|nr:S1C family serine protease [bacterium]HOG38153.1 S1C family serine protease [bacterium]HQI03373.1 S1C family serine protease [bacterium]
MKEKSKFFLSLLLTIIIVFIASSFVLYLVDKNIPEYLEENSSKKVNFIEIDKRNSQSITGSISSSLSNKIWLIVEKNDLSKNIYESMYFTDDFIGTAVVVTNDGWFVSKKINHSKNIALVNNENKIIDIETVINDDVLGLSYIKIKQNGLNPIGIIDSSSLGAGQNVYIIKPNLYDYQNEIIPASITNINSRFIKEKKDLIQNSEDIVIYGVLSLNEDPGLPVVNDNAEMLGFTYSYDDNTYLLPSNYIRYSLTRLFNNDKNIDYPSLNIEYIDLNKMVFSIDMPNNGIYVYKSSNNLIKEGDIIQKLNEDELNKFRSLNTVLLDYKPGDEVTLTILRDNKQQELKIKLSAFK